MSEPLAVIVPTVGRPELARCLSAVAEQTQADDHVYVVCDRPRRYNWCTLLVEGLRRGGVQGRFRVIPRDNLGHFGHPGRNVALDQLATLTDRPEWCWSLDDDDTPTPDALAAIRQAVASGEGPWYVFRMVGGGESHFAGVTIPNRGEYILPGNVGTPMLVFPATVEARFGTGTVNAPGPQQAGYFGDLEMAVALREELGDPVWVEETVCEVRPAAIVVSTLAT